MKRLHVISGRSELKPNYFSISTDSTTLISNARSLESSGGQYENVNFWNLSTGNLIRTINFWHDHIGVGCYDRWLIGIVNSANVIMTLNLETEEYNLIVDAAPRCLFYLENNVTPIAISPFEPIVVCGNFVYKAPEIGEVAAYNLLAKPISKEIGMVKLPFQRFRWQPEKYPSCNLSVLISPDSNTLLSQAVSIRYGFNRLWNLQTDQLIRTFAASSSGVAQCLTVNQLGQVLACGWRSKQVQVWDVHTDKVICSVDGHLPIAMTIDGRFLAYCRDQNKIILQDLEDSQSFWALNESSVKIELIALSPNGKWLASYNLDQTIEIWQVF